MSMSLSHEVADALKGCLNFFTKRSLFPYHTLGSDDIAPF